eukprot:INCI16290.11.p1 GENE.INCI16290.11~~INCI16290.11.p1  ORF type:complete len:725 (+),score=84.79 INCI16290.11:210-2384(+)
MHVEVESALLRTRRMSDSVDGSAAEELARASSSESPHKKRPRRTSAQDLAQGNDCAPGQPAAATRFTGATIQEGPTESHPPLALNARSMADAHRLYKWECNFLLLRRWVQKHGHSRVVRSLDTKQFPKLGAWVHRQRAAYRYEKQRAAGIRPKGTFRIDRSQIAKLESINFEWKLSPDASESASENYGHPGTGNHEDTVPGNRSDTSGPALPRPQSQTTDGTMHEGSRSIDGTSLALEKPNTTQVQPFTTPRNGVKRLYNWERNFCLLQRWVQRHGTTNVPRSVDSAEFSKLGAWVHRQRSAYRYEMQRAAGQKPTGKFRIGRHQIEKLNTLGFEWSVSASSCKAFAPSSVPCTFPQAQPTPQNETSLRAVYSSESTYSGRDYRCIPSTANPSPGRSSSPREHSIQSPTRTGSAVNVQHGASHSHPMPSGEHVRESAPSDTHCSADDEPAIVSAALRLNARALQERSGAGYARRMAAWVANFNLLRKYVKKHGHAHVPRDLDSSAFPRLGAWVHRQRMALRYEEQRSQGLTPSGNFRISPQQIAHLDALGFEWQGASPASQESNWEKMYQLLREYVEKHETTRVPVSFSTKEFPKLGAWVAAQRAAYRNETAREAGRTPSSTGRIMEEQIAKLDELGFEWGRMSDAKWDRMFQLLQAYVQEHGDANVPYAFSTPEYPKLGAWAHRQRTAFRYEQMRQAGEVPPGNFRIREPQVRKLQSIGFYLG